jgi:hypothetical protein
MRPNEAFSNSGRRLHECQRCRNSIPRAERARLSLMNDLRRVFRQRNISTRNIAWAESLANHEDERVRTLATLVTEVGRVHPHRRGRTSVLRRHHGELWQRMIAAAEGLESENVRDRIRTARAGSALPVSSAGELPV